MSSSGRFVSGTIEARRVVLYGSCGDWKWASRASTPMANRRSLASRVKVGEALGFFQELWQRCSYRLLLWVICK